MVFYLLINLLMSRHLIMTGLARSGARVKQGPENAPGIRNSHRPPAGVYLRPPPDPDLSRDNDLLVNPADKRANLLPPTLFQIPPHGDPDKVIRLQPLPLPENRNQPPSPGEHDNSPKWLWEWYCGDADLEELWQSMVLPVLKKTGHNKELLMQRLLPLVARELFGLECDYVYRIETKIHKDEASFLPTHHHVTGNTDLGRLFIVYRRDNTVGFLYQGQFQPQKAAHRTETLEDYLETFFSLDGTSSASNLTQNDYDLLVPSAVQSGLHHGDEYEPQTDEYFVPRLVQVPLAEPIGHRTQNNPMARATDEFDYDTRTAVEREFDNRRRAQGYLDRF